MKYLLIGILALGSTSVLAEDFNCTATINDRGQAKSEKLTVLRGVYTANIDGIAVSAQIDQLEDIGAFKMNVLDQKDGRLVGNYTGPAPLSGGRAATLSVYVHGLSAKVECEAI